MQKRTLKDQPANTSTMPSNRLVQKQVGDRGAVLDDLIIRTTNWFLSARDFSDTILLELSRTVQ